MKTQRLNSFDESSSMNQLLELSWGYQKCQVFLAACELDIFNILGDYEKTGEEVAATAGSNPNSMIRLLNALVSMDLLNKSGNLYSNSPATRTFLTKESPEFLGDFGHARNLYLRWNSLADAVRRGHSVLDRLSGEEDKDYIEKFIAAMHWRASRQSRDIIEMVYLSQTKKMLDLGGGPGTFAMEFVRAKPDLEVYVFDLPEVIPLTKRYLTQYGFEDKVRVIEGDYFADSLGQGYDLVFLSMVIHSNSIFENIELMKKIYLSMNPGGQVIIHEFVISDDRTNPLYTALFSLNMLINTQSGDTYTETDIWITLKEAWFRDIQFQKTKFGTFLVTGKR